MTTHKTPGVGTGNMNEHEHMVLPHPILHTDKIWQILFCFFSFLFPGAFLSAVRLMSCFVPTGIFYTLFYASASCTSTYSAQR
jgi:hypothetical protein